VNVPVATRDEGEGETDEAEELGVIVEGMMGDEQIMRMRRVSYVTQICRQPKTISGLSSCRGTGLGDMNVGIAVGSPIG